MDHYKILDWRNQEPGEQRSRGGVLILAKWGVECTVKSKEFLLDLPLNCCSVIIHAMEKKSSPFRLTGVYLPPPLTAKVKINLLEPLTKLREFRFLETR